MLTRSAAIKLIRPSVPSAARPGISEEARRRFEREAQAIALLRSPHTVELFDFGVSTDGAFYYVMELLDGLDADTLVRQFVPVPAAGMNTELTITQVNVVHGTPAFMAPEQALGRSNVDGRADIYATGCVAYWLLTGELVFTAETAMALFLHHAHTPPLPPSARTERPIPEALDQLVLSCLAKDPAERPQSARELSLRLAAVEGASAWIEDRARDWWTRHQPVQQQERKSIARVSDAPVTPV